MKKIIVFLFFSWALSLQSQNILLELQQADPLMGRIAIFQDEKIANHLLARINEIENNGMIDGFRINIFSDDSQRSKEKAMSVRSSFIANYNYECEYMYNAPDSKLYVGNFRTKSEAQKALNLIKQSYPKAFIKPGKINLPDLE